MKNAKYNSIGLATLLMAGLAMTGCSDKETNLSPSVQVGAPILFSVGQIQSRTYYTDEDKYQIDWNDEPNYDRIGIYCEQALPGSSISPNQHAIYQVQKVNEPGHEFHGTIQSISEEGTPSGVENEYGLMWNENLNQSYTFYGAYPESRIKRDADNKAIGYPASTDDGIFTMEYITNQTVTIDSRNNGVYTTVPDMLNAYMMARKTFNPTVDNDRYTDDHILLSFDPIMTTLDINVTAGSYEVATGIIQPVTVTGVSVMMPGKLDGGELKYNVTEGSTFETGGALTNVNKDYKESVFVGISDKITDAEKERRYVDLFEGESINLLAFLPPMEMNATEGIILKVHTVGPLDFTFKLNSGELKRQHRIDIQLPDVSAATPEHIRSNNWISQLDGNIQLAQMSIPGYECNDEEEPGDIKNLLKMGVRVFDIDNIINHGGNVLDDYYRDLPQNLVEVFNSFIGKNSDEFIILLYDGNHDASLTDAGLGLLEIGFNKDNWKNKSISELKGHIVAFEWRTVLGPGYVESQTGAVITSSNPYTFDRYGITSKDKIGEVYPNINWNMVYMDWDRWDDVDDGVKIDATKTIYEKIASEKGQSCNKGCTGIVLVPNAGETIINGQYTYSDLLIQSIIDCNYKFILDRN